MRLCLQRFVVMCVCVTMRQVCGDECGRVLDGGGIVVVVIVLPQAPEDDPQKR